jgi:hypothetical protein
VSVNIQKFKDEKDQYKQALGALMLMILDDAEDLTAIEREPLKYTTLARMILGQIKNDSHRFQIMRSEFCNLVSGLDTLRGECIRSWKRFDE